MTRASADWMAAVDDRILEYLEQRGPVSLQDVHAALEKGCGIPYARAETANRPERRLHYRLASSVGRADFFPTDVGSRYLEGDRNAGILHSEGHPRDDESHGQRIK